ncbi:alpha-amylase family glycosyl hydrolase [Mycoplasma iguanae]|uniref:Alpha-amylase family glycosyl hydrolase n=1 Tax=Mycoplasma iguanae TaxID=292461 RepID=A0ABY5R8R9_9MOLU|nr:alpha-amylase family glycosyl hydrolase [Mycoplasma iguanae]UVD81906.1 alpha-amylase family glycosyl hydrolase [Mycoplasma iguanae]
MANNNIERITKIDANLANVKAKLGVYFFKKFIKFSLWQPEALEVSLLVYDQANPQLLVFKKTCIKKQNVWTTKIDLKYEKYFYTYLITHPNKTQKEVLDPYAKSMAAFNWLEVKSQAKGAIVNLNATHKIEYRNNLNETLINNPVIYELHIRDFTSLWEANLKTRKGTFLAAMEAGLFPYLKNLGISHLQILPINATYTIDETNLNILNKSQGNGLTTNYNWGYDPHNYFTINGWFSSNPHDPYSRINEFKMFVNEAHKHNIKIVMDVVYNHLFKNDILNDVLSDYYFRDFSQVWPVDQPALASERKMVQKLILDSLIYFVKEFDIDGFRFDLSCFIDKITLTKIVKRLQKIKKSILLHGEAWPWSDLDFNNTWIKGVNTNKYGFAYFNDSTRNAIKGKDLFQNLDTGLVNGNLNYFNSYINGIVGNIKNYPFINSFYSQNKYDNFAVSPLMNLQYSACHDGFTLWDKINVSSDANLITKIDQYRQALMLQLTTQGKQLFLAGTEFLQSKPNDATGAESGRILKINPINDFFNLEPFDNGFNENSYKTTDYVNGLKWSNLKNINVKKAIFNFFKEILHFYKNTNYFQFKTSQEIIDNIHFIKVIYGFTIFRIYDQANPQKEIIVIHNFLNQKIDLAKDINLQNYELIFSSKANIRKITKNIEPHCSWILSKKGEK